MFKGICLTYTKQKQEESYKKDNFALDEAL